MYSVQSQLATNKVYIMYMNTPLTSSMIRNILIIGKCIFCIIQTDSRFLFFIYQQLSTLISAP